MRLLPWALVGLTAAGVGALWLGRLPAPAPWPAGRAGVVSLRVGVLDVDPVVRDGACGEALGALLDAVEEGRVDAVEVSGVDPSAAGLRAPTPLRIAWSDGRVAHVDVGSTVPVGGRTYVGRDGQPWAVHGDLRPAVDAVAAACGMGEGSDGSVPEEGPWSGEDSD